MKEFDRFSFPRNYSGKVPLSFWKFPEKFRRKFPEISELTTLFNILSVDKLHVLQILLLVFKCLYHSDLVPSIYSNYFVLNNEIHIYNTRLSQGLHICGPRTSFGQKCIHYKGSSLWNRLSSSLKLPSSVVVFKKSLKLSEYTVTW